MQSIAIYDAHQRYLHGKHAQKNSYQKLESEGILATVGNCEQLRAEDSCKQIKLLKITLSVKFIFELFWKDEWSRKYRSE